MERIHYILRFGLLLSLTIIVSGCAKDWTGYRHNLLRNAHQPNASGLSDPAQVGSLSLQWTFPPPGWTGATLRAFRASPIVYKGKVYIGNGNGYFYALDANTGALLWQYPPAGQPALDSLYHSNPSSFGIASSAVIAKVNGDYAVIFGAPDPDPAFGSGLGSGRLFALNAQTGTVIWKSPEVARLTGTTWGSTSEFHEQIGYSSPLVLNNRVYIGIGNHGDNPIQNGRIVAVNLSDGSIDAAFSFEATSTRGGGVWTSVAGWLNKDIYVTSGNVRCWNGGCQLEPAVNHALSLMRLNAETGAVVWKLQPVPFVMDNDPDWASGAVVQLTSCGVVITSTMKDGWSYAVNRGDGVPGAPSVRWQFPNTGFPFTPAGGTNHGDSRYLVPGSGWGDVFVTMTGGENVVSNVSGGYGRLHALNVCTGSYDRIRWILNVPGTSGGGAYQLGPPTVTRGIFYVGTNQGRLIVFADPSKWPSTAGICSNPDISNANCLANGYHFVQMPTVLANIDLDPAQSNDQILTEPVLAKGRVYVATSPWSGPGKLYMLEP